MLVLAAVIALSNSPVDAFVGECGRAVATIREGVWGYEMTSPGGKAQRLVMFRKGDVTRARHFDGDNLDVEIVTTPTMTLTVVHGNRRFQRRTYPAAKAHSLPTLEEGVCDFQLHAREGLVFRANPDFVDVKVGGDELRATWRKEGEAETTFVLRRDPKAKLPIALTIGNPGRGETTVRFSFVARTVADEELSIDPKAYAGYDEIKAP